MCRFGLSASSFHNHHLTDNTSSDFQTQWHFRYLPTRCVVYSTCMRSTQSIPFPCTLFTSPSSHSQQHIHLRKTLQPSLNLLPRFRLRSSQKPPSLAANHHEGCGCLVFCLLFFLGSMRFPCSAAAVSRLP